MTRKERLTARNNEVRKLFYDLQNKNPKWRVDAVIEEVEKKMFLSKRTIDAIINHEGTYNNNLKASQTTQSVLFQFQ